jgi:hypothetical protein
MDIKESAVSEQGNSVQQGTESKEGQPLEGSENTQGQPKDNMSTQGQPNDGDLSATKSSEAGPEDWQVKYEGQNKDYTELQTEFNKRNEASKLVTDNFQAFGGVDKAQQYLQYLAGNERFAKFIADEQQREVVGGQDVSQMDEEQKQAMGVVQKMIDTAFDSKIQNVLGEKVDPLIKDNRERSIGDNLTKLQDKWGDIFNENRDLMKSEVDANANNPMYANPSYDQLEDLMWNAIRRSGKQDQYMAKAHQISLEKKKQNSTDPPPTTTTTPAPVNAKSISEAFAAAKRDLGIVGEVRL